MVCFLFSHKVEQPILSDLSPAFGDPQEKIRIEANNMDCLGCPVSFNYTISFANHTIEFFHEKTKKNATILTFYAPEGSSK